MSELRGHSKHSEPTGLNGMNGTNGTNRPNRPNRPNGPNGPNGPKGGSEHQLRVDWPACQAHGLCAEILPEVVSLDEWGYPVLNAAVADDVLELAKSAVKACPTLALRLTRWPAR